MAPHNPIRSDLTVTQRIDHPSDDWELAESLIYEVSPQGEMIVVPVGMVTDFASVPRPLWWWAAPWGRHGRAAVVHDYLYRGGTVRDANGVEYRPTRAQADRIFREALAALDVGRARRWLMWAGVRIGGIGGGIDWE